MDIKRCALLRGTPPVDSFVDIPNDLAPFITSWPDLAEPIRTAILYLAAVVRQSRSEK